MINVAWYKKINRKQDKKQRKIHIIAASEI